ncbi:MAG: hypothetical protein OER88_10680 [Planctomycetota bacterium]|nr:hypothetical protein [Planctomycetota bacterium]
MRFLFAILVFGGLGAFAGAPLGLVPAFVLAGVAIGALINTRMPVPSPRLQRALRRLGFLSLLFALGVWGQVMFGRRSYRAFFETGVWISYWCTALGLWVLLVGRRTAPDARDVADAF